MTGKCKDCRFLSQQPCRKDGRLVTPGAPADDFFYYCDWVAHQEWPWAMRPRPGKDKYIIGKRHIETDWPIDTTQPVDVQGSWSDVMDCPKWEAKP